MPIWFEATRLAGVVFTLVFDWIEEGEMLRFTSWYISSRRSSIARMTARSSSGMKPGLGTKLSIRHDYLELERQSAVTNEKLSSDVGRVVGANPVHLVSWGEPRFMR